MLAVVDVVAQFDISRIPAQWISAVRTRAALTLTGEGSSRIFPSKQAIRIANQRAYSTVVRTVGGCEASLYAASLRRVAVLGISNSGRTAEVVGLFRTLRERDGHNALFALTAFNGSALETASDAAATLACGKESAVAATKSVVEQALFCIALLEAVTDGQDPSAIAVPKLSQRLPGLAMAMRSALLLAIPDDIVAALVASPLIYWAGFNDGVAEELTLKTNEITRKPAHFLEGTYAVHGVEEVMHDNDVLVWIEPIEWQEQKFYDTLVKAANIKVVAISTRQTRFPTLVIPDCGDLTGFVALAAGWNLLVSVGTRLGVDVDKPQRARKVGNEITI